MHDQWITAISKNYRRSVNTQIVIGAQRSTVVAVGRCWPGKRNDVIVARHTVADLFDGRVVRSDGGYRGIDTITSPRRGPDGRITRDNHYRAHRRIRARVEHVIARLKDRQILRNAGAAAKPSTTASKSSPDSGTSRLGHNYGSTPRARRQAGSVRWVGSRAATQRSCRTPIRHSWMSSRNRRTSSSVSTAPST